ncbi:MAG: hypothetical protein ACD_73C00740G0001, partial [uncultured bacterium]
NQNPQSLEDKKQGLLNLADWQFKDEPFRPLREYLIHPMVRSGEPAESYWDSVLAGNPHQDLIAEAETRLRIFFSDENQRGFNWMGIMGGWPGYAELMQDMPEGLRAKHARRISRNPAVQLVDLLTKGKLVRFKTQFESELSGHDPHRVSFIQKILSDFMNSPLDVLGFMYWLIGLPHTDNGIEFQGKVVSNIMQYLDHLKTRSIQVFGNILFTFLDRTHNTQEELMAALFHAKDGDHIHFLPPTLKQGAPTPDLMLISKEGDVKLVEVKKMNWDPELPPNRLSERLGLSIDN